MADFFERHKMPMTSVTSGQGDMVAEGVYSLCVQIVNVGYVEAGADWFLIDAGMLEGAGPIIEQAEELFGVNRPPRAIVLTHGHFDPIGAMPDLLKAWDVPIYAHEAEVPYLTGKAEYPPGDPSVGGGLVSGMSPTFPHDGLDLGNRVNVFQDEAVPGMTGWRVIHTSRSWPCRIMADM